MERYTHILGCLLGTALGDAVGLRREGLSRRRAARMYGGPPLTPNLILGRGLCSDDTEHTQIVGRALVLSNGDVDKFEQELCSQFKRWLLSLPAGVGLATLRACLKLLLGFSPSRSGVFSAGNGPSMRSALIGVWSDSESQLQDFVRCCSRITHTDPKAEEGALIVARAARLKVNGIQTEPIDFLAQIAGQVKGEELSLRLRSAYESLTKKKTPMEYVDSQGWNSGVSGYVNQTVPAALYCWAYSPNNFRKCVEDAVLLGGDTDSVAAIAGAICGANLGSDRIPNEWLDSLSEWPRGMEWMEQLAERLCFAPANEYRQKPLQMHWLACIPRNVMFAAVVLGIGFRRLVPPY